jgi:hypothetical protein
MDNIISKAKIRETMIYTIVHRKIKVEQHES